MELRHLRYFVAIAEERSFTRAAEKLWIAQPGLSTQIRRLEEELGVRLFERHTRGVDLTEAGELLLDRARATLAAAEAARSTGRDLEAGLVGSVRLGVATCAGWSGTSGLLARFGRDWPEVEVTVSESYGGTLVRDLRDGRLDAVLAPVMFATAELRQLKMGREPWLVLAGASHRLARGEGPVAAGELRAERVVATGHRDAAAYDRAVAETLAELGVVYELLRAGSGPAFYAPVVCGDALALTTAPAAGAGGLAARRLEPARGIDFALLWPDKTPAPALERFVDAAASCAEGDPAQRLARNLAEVAGHGPGPVGGRRIPPQSRHRARRRARQRGDDHGQPAAGVVRRAAIPRSRRSVRGPGAGRDHRARSRRRALRSSSRREVLDLRRVVDQTRGEGRRRRRAGHPDSLPRRAQARSGRTGGDGITPATPGTAEPRGGRRAHRSQREVGTDAARGSARHRIPRRSRGRRGQRARRPPPRPGSCGPLGAARRPADPRPGLGHAQGHPAAPPRSPGAPLRHRRRRARPRRDRRRPRRQRGAQPPARTPSAPLVARARRRPARHRVTPGAAVFGAMRRPWSRRGVGWRARRCRRLACRARSDATRARRSAQRSSALCSRARRCASERSRSPRSSPAKCRATSSTCASPSSPIRKRTTLLSSTRAAQPSSSCSRSSKSSRSFSASSAMYSSADAYSSPSGRSPRARAANSVRSGSASTSTSPAARRMSPGDNTQSDGRRRHGGRHGRPPSSHRPHSATNISRTTSFSASGQSYRSAISSRDAMVPASISTGGSSASSSRMRGTNHRKSRSDPQVSNALAAKSYMRARGAVSRSIEASSCASAVLTQQVHPSTGPSGRSSQVISYSAAIASRHACSASLNSSKPLRIQGVLPAPRDAECALRRGALICSAPPEPRIQPARRLGPRSRLGGQRPAAGGRTCSARSGVRRSEQAASGRPAWVGGRDRRLPSVWVRARAGSGSGRPGSARARVRDRLASLRG